MEAVIQLLSNLVALVDVPCIGDQWPI